METKTTTPATQGVILSIVLIVLGLIIHFAGLGMVKGISLLQFSVLAGGIIWACINYSKQLDANVTFGNLFAFGFKVSAAVAAILAVYTFIALKYITPEILDLSIEKAREGMIEKKSMNEADIENGLAMMKKFFIPFAIGGAILAYLVMGCIFSLIGAAVAKKNPNYNPLEQ